MDLILNTIRKIDNDQEREFIFGDVQSLEENLAIAFLNPTDYKELKLTKNNHLRISNEIGSIIVKVGEDEHTPEGCIILPVSIWANRITKIEDGGLSFKNVTVSVESTNEPITKFRDIIKQIKGE
jgi:formylmethanofuran dehydrogenase subunit D